MLSKIKVIRHALELPNVFEDYPFEEDYETTVLKHSDTGKWFAIIMKVDGRIYLNVKTEPEYSDLLRKTYSYIIPAYHMNKEHWNTIILSEQVEEKLVYELLENSYELTKKKRKEKRKKQN